MAYSYVSKKILFIIKHIWFEQMLRLSPDSNHLTSVFYYTLSYESVTNFVVTMRET